MNAEPDIVAMDELWDITKVSSSNEVIDSSRFHLRVID